MKNFLSIVLMGVWIVCPGTSKARPKVGIALSGGGARAFAHVGVLKALKELDIPIDFITGTSMGAFIGSLYAIGYSVEEIEQIILKTDWNNVFNDDLSRKNYIMHQKEHHHRYLFDFELGFRGSKFHFPQGMLSGHRFDAFLQGLTYHVYDQNDFSKYPVPLCIYATDLTKGTAHSISSGNLGLALRASMAYAGVVAPLELDGKWLIDGYFSNNVPVSKLKKMGAEYTIAVDVSDSNFEHDSQGGFLKILGRATTILVELNSKHELSNADLVFLPEIPNMTSTSFEQAAEAIKKGREQAKNILKEVKNIKVSNQEYQAYDKRRTSWRERHIKPIKVGQVVVSQNQKINAKFVINRIELDDDRVFREEKIQRSLDNIYGWGDFEKVTYYLSKSGDYTVLNVHPHEKSWGPNYLRFGLQFDSETDGLSEVVGLVNFSMNHINRYGGIWKSDAYFGDLLGLYTEFYQPIKYGSPLFLRLSSSYLRSDQSLFAEDELVDEYFLASFRSSIKLGITFGKNSELSGGVYASLVDAGADLSTTPLSDESYLLSGFTGTLTIDRLDQKTFPSTGIYFVLDHDSTTFFGSDLNYHKSSLNFEHYININYGSVFYRLISGYSYGSNLPFFDEFTLGGIGIFSGLRREELRGQYLSALRLGYDFPVLKKSTFLFRGIRIGFFSDIGNTWNSLRNADFDDLKIGGGIELGLDTKLSPIHIGYGQQGSSNYQVYLRFGPVLGRR